MSVQRIISIAAIVLVVAAVGLGFAMTGPPAEMRERSFDDTRVRDLSTLTERVTEVYADANMSLPQHIGPNIGGGVNYSTRDPQSGRPYEYTRIDSRHYRLCAVFSRPSDTSGPLADPYWAHGAGRTCYNLTADAADPVQSSLPRTITH